MFLRLLVILGLLGLAGCVTTPDYRYVSSTGGYYSGNGYYTDDGYYDRGGSYYAGSGTYVSTTVYNSYPGWGFSPWSGYGGYGYGGYPGLGFGFAGYGSYGFMPGWGGYFGSGWGSYWGGYGYSPFYASYVPYWYYSDYARQRDRNRRDLRGVHAEQLRQADYQRSLNRVPQGSAGIRTWTPSPRSTREAVRARGQARGDAVRQAELQQRIPMRSTSGNPNRRFRDTTPASTRHEVMPRGIPANRNMEVRPSRPMNMPVRSSQGAPRGMPAPRSVPVTERQAMPSMPMRSAPRSMPTRSTPPSMPASDGGHEDSRGGSHRESHRRPESS